MPRNITVTFADGTSHVYQNAPDNVTPEQVSARAKADFGKEVKALDGGRQAPKTVADRYNPGQQYGASSSRTVAAMNAYARGATAGLSDYVEAGIAAPVNYAIDRYARGQNPTMAGEFQRALDFKRAQNQGEAQAHPTTVTTANILGGVASPINKLKVLGGASKAKQLLIPAAAYGAVSGAADSKGTPLQRVEAAGESALSSVAGAFLGDKLVKGAGKVLAPKFSPAVKALLDKGVQLTPGQLAGGAIKSAEDKLMSLPGVGGLIKDARHRTVEQWNRAMYDRVLEPLSVKFQGDKVGHEGIAQLEASLSRAYDSVLPKLKFKNDPQFVKDIVGTLNESRELPPDEMGQLRAIIENRIAPRFGNNGEMSGQTFKQLESELTNIIGKYRGSADAGQREMAARLNDMLGSMRSGLERSNPSYAPALKKLNQSYAAFVRLQNAASRRPTANGVFTPADLLAAAKATDKSVRKGSFARGSALMQKEAKQAQSVLPSTVPNSGTFDRAAAGAAVLESPKIAGMAISHPVMAAGAGLAAGAYTRPGMSLVNAIARTKPGLLRKSGAKIAELTAPLAAQTAAVAGAGVPNLLTGGQ